MDLLLIVRKIWRYRIVTLPVILLALLGGAYAVMAKDPVYEASASYVLINPPAPPTQEEIARNPELGRINSDNPYARFPDPSTLVQVLSSTMSGESARKALSEQGADDRYTVAPTNEFGYSSPIVHITGVGSTPEEAIRTAEIVGGALNKELERMQQSQGVDPRYEIKTHQVNGPDEATLKASGQLRVLVGVLALGAILLFVVVSVGDALTTLRQERTRRTGRPRLPDEDELGAAAVERTERLNGLDQEHEPGTNGTSVPGGRPVDLFPDIDREPIGPRRVARARNLPSR